MPYQPSPGYFWIMTDIIPVIQYEDYPYNFPGGTYTNYLDFYLFTGFRYFPQYHTTLCADELNFYFSKAIELADVILPQQYNITISETHRCYSINVGCGRAYCGSVSPENLVRINHSINFYYGNRVTIGQEEPLEF